MHAPLKILATVLCTLAAAAGLGAARDAQAQRYGGRGDQEVYCASNDSRGSRCQMPWRDSQLAQQMSQSACIEGRTWGSEPGSVWVKDGCRGNFRDARGGSGGRPGYAGPGREVYCASNDSRGSRCQMPWRYSEMSRQMSQAACIEGRTWGSDPGSVWVKDGCRAQFVEARGGRRW